jgi:hypothetical protein
MTSQIGEGPGPTARAFCRFAERNKFNSGQTPLRRQTGRSPTPAGDRQRAAATVRKVLEHHEANTEIAREGGEVAVLGPRSKCPSFLDLAGLPLNRENTA